ncbi:DeoR family transcriptional regulator, partial [Heyndrickxia coagulans]|nr:DeoR family transcriptional regulator [Heyndrickxia coagulans]
VSSGTDPIIFSAVLNGNRTTVESGRSLYIANPRNAADPFNVSVYAIY